MGRPLSERHDWNHKGPWRLSKDVRRCNRCRLFAYKVGMRSGYMTWQGDLDTPHERHRYSDSMPRCTGEAG